MGFLISLEEKTELVLKVDYINSYNQAIFSAIIFICDLGNSSFSCFFKSAHFNIGAIVPPVHTCQNIFLNVLSMYLILFWGKTIFKSLSEDNIYDISSLSVSN